MATAVHYFIMWGAICLGWSGSAATALGAAVGAGVNYLLQYHFTFQSTRSHRAASGRYGLSVVFSWLLNSAFFHVLTASAGVNVYTAQLLTTLCVALCNYVVMKRYVFM